MSRTDLLIACVGLACLGGCGAPTPATGPMTDDEIRRMKAQDLAVDEAEMEASGVKPAAKRRRP